MNILTLRTGLTSMLTTVRQHRLAVITALDTLEDDVLTKGPVMLGGVKNEELKQSVDAVRNDLEQAIAALRRALTTVEQVDSVAKRYAEASISHPVVTS